MIRRMICALAASLLVVLAQAGPYASAVPTVSLVKDIVPGPAGSVIKRATEVGGTFYFAAHVDDKHGLWRSDGTKAGTVLVRNFVAGPFPWFYFADVAGTLFFQADDGTHGRELWKSDGTEAGTVMVKDIRPGPDSVAGIDFTEAADAMYFHADDGIHGPSCGRATGPRRARSW